MNNKDITVIILLYNTPSKMIKNLNSYKSFNLAILDQSGDYKTRLKIKKMLKKIYYYKVSNENKGFAKGVNFLVNKVKTKFFLCTQADVKISQNSILKLKKTFLKNKECFVSIPHIKEEKNCKYLNSKKDIQSDSFYGSIFFTSKRKFKKMGMFDENFFFYWEDIDLSKRVKEKNQKIIISKKAKAKHMAGQSTKLSIKSLFIREVNFKFGEYLFEYKHNKLKSFKIIRQIINNIFYVFFNLLLIDKNNFFKKVFQIFGIIKFLFFVLFYNYKGKFKSIEKKIN